MTHVRGTNFLFTMDRGYSKELTAVVVTVVARSAGLWHLLAFGEVSGELIAVHIQAVCDCQGSKRGKDEGPDSRHYGCVV